MNASAGTTLVRATVVMVPRESFVETERCLGRLLECTPAPRRIVVVDGGSPHRTASLLEHAAHESDFTLVRSDHQLTPNEARNLGMAYATTEWIAFIDNDAYVQPGWLDGMLDCADQNNASAVAPLYCIGEPGRDRVHMGGPDCTLIQVGGHTQLSEQHPHANQDRTAVAADTRRECGAFEFHAVLLRRDALDEVAPLDEGLLSILEHVDLSLLLKARGHSIWYDPTVAVTYIPAKAPRGADRWHFVTRWSDEWNERSAKRFRAKWTLAVDDPQVRDTVEFGAWMRSHAYLPYRSPWRRLAQRRGRASRPLIDRAAQRHALARHRRKIAAASPPRVVHRATWMPALDAGNETR